MTICTILAEKNKLRKINLWMSQFVISPQVTWYETTQQVLMSMKWESWEQRKPISEDSWKPLAWDKPTWNKRCHVETQLREWDPSFYGTSPGLDNLFIPKGTKLKMEDGLCINWGQDCSMEWETYCGYMREKIARKRSRLKMAIRLDRARGIWERGGWEYQEDQEQERGAVMIVNRDGL